MIAVSEYMQHDAVGLAARVQKREVTPTELLEAALARAAEVNPRLNAIVISMESVARARANEALRGPLAGVPFLIKDLYQDYAGVLATSGSNAWKRAGYTPPAHSEIVRRWLEAGLVVFGRTNSPELGAKGITEPDAWGPTHNPWDLARSAGGSSGGSASAVAAGIVPAAGASDGGGSIRIPSASTGLFGLKPGRGRTPCGPGLGEAMHGAAMNHVLTRTVRDSAALLDATHGPELGGWCRIAPPERSYLEEASRDPKPLRVAFTTRSPIDAPVDREIIEATERTATLLERLGHTVERAEPAIDGQALAHDFLNVWFGQLAARVHEAMGGLGATLADFELDTVAAVSIGNARSSRSYAASYTGWNRYGYQLAQHFTSYDVYLTPSLAVRPPRLGALKTPAWAQRVVKAGIPLGLTRLIPLAQGTIEEIVLTNLRGVSFTQLANVTGVPAMSVPLETFADGFPIGMQFVAPSGGEGRLYALAGQLERAKPWVERRPTL